MALFHIQFLTDKDRLQAVEVLDRVGDTRHGLPNSQMLVSERSLEALQERRVQFRFMTPPRGKEEVSGGSHPSV